MTLNELFPSPHVADLVARKLAGPEQSALADDELAFHRGEYERPRGVLDGAMMASTLPESPGAKPALNDLLIRLRTGATGAGGSTACDGPRGR